MLKIKPTKNDNIDEALEIVLDLAFQGVNDKYDNPRAYKRQMDAIRMIRETFCRSGELR